MDEMKKSFKKKFKAFRDSIYNEIGIKMVIISKNIDLKDPKKWDEMKNEYKTRRLKFKSYLDSLNSK